MFLSHDTEAKSLAGAWERQEVVESVFECSSHNDGLELQVGGHGHERASCAWAAAVGGLHAVWAAGKRSESVRELRKSVRTEGSESLSKLG